MITASRPRQSGAVLAVLAAWRLWQESQGLSERTISERANVVMHLLAFAGVGPLELTPGHIIGYLARPGINRTTKSTYHATIKAYCVWLVRTRQRGDDPTLETPSPHRASSTPRPITGAQLETMLGRVNRRRTRMMILLAALAGLRVHEIAKIRAEDFDLTAGLLYVTGKGGKTAALPVHGRILEAAAGFPAAGWWFPNHAGTGPIIPAAVSRVIRDTMRRAGVPGTPHALRHYYATALLEGGTDIRVVQELMRHSSLGTTALYTRVSDVQRRDAIGRLFAQR